jgi:hypothetical protein
MGNPVSPPIEILQKNQVNRSMTAAATKSRVMAWRISPRPLDPPGGSTAEILTLMPSGAASHPKSDIHRAT